MGQVWSTLLCISSGRIPSYGAGYHQWDHFCIHPKLLIRGSWIFKCLSSLICLTISILSLGLFCGFSLLRICSVIHASSSDVTDFEMIPAIPGSPKGWVFSLPWLPAFPCSFWFQRWLGGGTACRVPLWELASPFCKFLLIIIIQYICLSPQILQKIVYHPVNILAFCKCKKLTFFSEWGRVSFPSEYLTIRFEQNRICSEAQL